VHGCGAFAPIGPSYFQAFKIPVIRGRAFTDQDNAAAPKVVIINQAMAKRYWANGDPLADRLTVGGGLGPRMGLVGHQIVGIVGDVRDGALNRDPGPVMYFPWAQVPDAHSANLIDIVPIAWIIRTRGEPYALSAAIQRELRIASGGLPAARPRSMEEVVSRSTARSDFNMILLTTFAAAALVLAAIGIYGLMAYSVQQRTQEIGIRMALGAEPSSVLAMVVRQGMTLVALGLALGVLGGLVISRVMSGLVFGIAAYDPVTFLAGGGVLAAVGALACLLPARRAAEVDPMIALRSA
jgi:putative ABC transport system permease protein